jgi:hypothetical protein
VQSFDVDGVDVVDVMIERQLTNADGLTGYVVGDFGVAEPLSAEAVAHQKSACREAQEKVSPRDGTDCMLVPDGMIEVWDDRVPPDDKSGLARGIRMAWVNYTRWDGGVAMMRALNSTASDVPPEAGAMPVIRSSELVELVQQMKWFAEPVQAGAS